MKRYKEKEKLNNSVQNKYYNRYINDENKVKENEEKIKGK